MPDMTIDHQIAFGHMPPNCQYLSTILKMIERTDLVSGSIAIIGTTESGDT
jgi:hypothetical protein